MIIISLSTPLLITCVSYCIIWRKQASRIPSEVRERKDVHLNKTQLLITVVFVLSWLPFQVLPILMSFCISCQILTMILCVAKFLRYSNSFVNFLVYCFRMPDFRKALSRMLPQMQCRCSRVAKESSSVLSAQWSTLKQVSCLPILIFTLRTGNMYLCEILKSMRVLSS